MLWPPAQGERAGRDALVCRLDYGKTGILLAGAADGEEEGYLVADAAASLPCDVLEVAAAGSGSATSAEMLRRAAPSVAVISCAAAVPPGQTTLHRLAAAGAAVWRTDTQGAITLYTDGQAPPLLTATHL